MKGKVCVVTGASSGIGRATATALASTGATVVMVCRDQARGIAARDHAVTESANQLVDLRIADLSSLESVRGLATTLGSKYPGLDVLVNNAATFASKRIVTADGLELMFETNYLGPFLLTRLLVPRLEASKPSKVINISAPSSMMPDLDDLQGEGKFAPIMAFGASKAADLLFTYALARRLADRGVTVNAYHPGLVRTNLLRGAPAPVRVISGILNVFMGVSPQRATKGLVELASSTQLDVSTGELVRNGKPMRAPFSGDIEAQEKLWLASCMLTGLPETV